MFELIFGIWVVIVTTGFSVELGSSWSGCL